MFRIPFSRFLLLVALLATSSAFAQEVEEEDDYASAIVYGINFNTNGGLIGGGMIKYSWSAGERMYQSLGLEIVNVKHPKEARYAFSNYNSFVYGKSNFLFVVRPQYGRELVLFRKAPDQGVQINAIGAAGPSIGLVKPYYIQYYYSATNTPYEQFDPEKHNPNSIMGSGPLFAGFGDSKITMGIHAKVGLSFELSGFRNSVTGFEVGYLLEAFTNKIIIIPRVENRSVFGSAYLSLYFGSKQ